MSEKPTPTLLEDLDLASRYPFYTAEEEAAIIRLRAVLSSIPALEAENEALKVNAAKESADWDACHARSVMMVDGLQSRLTASQAMFTGLREAWENNKSAPIGSCPACDAVDVFLDDLDPTTPESALIEHDRRVLEAAAKRVRNDERCDWDVQRAEEKEMLEIIEAAILGPATASKDTPDTEEKP